MGKNYLTKHDWILGRAFFIYFLLLPLGTVNIGELGSMLKLFAIALVAIWLLTNRKIDISRIVVLQFLIALFMSLSLLWTINVEGTLTRTISNISFAALLLVASGTHLNKNMMLFLKKGLFLSSIVTALLMIFWGTVVDNRLFLDSVVIEDPNYLCGYLLFGIVSSLENSIDKNMRRSKRVFHLCLLVFFILTAFLTGSRGGMIAVIATIICAYFFSNHTVTDVPKLIVTIGVFGAVVYCFQDFLGASLLNRFSADTLINTTGSGRFVLWSNAILILKENDIVHTLFGYGAGSIREIYNGNFYTTFVMHNIYIEVLLENGIIFFIIYLYQILYNIHISYKLKDNFTFSLLIGVFVLGLSLSLYAFKVYWNIVLYLVMLLNCERDTNIKHIN